MKNQSTDNGPQRKKFIEKARDLECDEDEAAFDDKLRQLGKSDQDKGKSGEPSPGTHGPQKP
jgi:hypothetical protein